MGPVSNVMQASGYSFGAAGVVAAAVGVCTMIWASCRGNSASPIEAPPSPPPSAILLNPKEMSRLSDAGQQYEANIRQLSEKIQTTREILEEKRSELGFRDRLFFTPRAKEVDQLRQTIKSQEVALQTAVARRDNFQNLTWSTERIGQAECHVQDLRERTKTAWEKADKTNSVCSQQWTSLSKSQKVIYCIPTATLRRGAGALLGTNTDAVETYIRHKKLALQSTDEAHRSQREIQAAYKELIKNMHQTIAMDQEGVHGRESHRNVIKAYTLARVLNEEVKQTLSAISTYRAMDSATTALEIDAENASRQRAEYYSSNHPTNGENLAGLGRVATSIQLAYVTSHLNRVQELAKNLQETAELLETAIDTQSIRAQDLNGTSESMWIFNLADIYGANRSIYAVPLNLVEYANNERIVGILQSIGQGVSPIEAKLLESATNVFVGERSMLRQMNPDETGDAQLFRDHTVSYLQSLTA